MSGERRRAHRVLVRETDGERPSKWEDNIKLDVPRYRTRSLNCIDEAHDKDRGRVHMKVAINIWVHKMR